MRRKLCARSIAVASYQAIAADTMRKYPATVRVVSEFARRRR
jgi:hypothetical protein